MKSVHSFCGKEKHLIDKTIKTVPSCVSSHTGSRFQNINTKVNRVKGRLISLVLRSRPHQPQFPLSFHPGRPWRWSLDRAVRQLHPEVSVFFFLTPTTTDFDDCMYCTSTAIIIREKKKTFSHGSGSATRWMEDSGARRALQVQL